MNSLWKLSWDQPIKGVLHRSSEPAEYAKSYNTTTDDQARSFITRRTKTEEQMANFD